MELKRFILLSNNTIVDVSKEKYYLTQTGLIRYRENAIMQVTQMGTVKSTSDNILDLVEVGDILLRNDDFYYHIVVTDISEDTFYGEHESIWIGNKISHLWKRQTNGDYKRYEVKA